MQFKQFEKYTYIQPQHHLYLEELKHFVSKSKYLPRYHIYPKCGLMNDPIGLAYFNNQYHVFYQWFPFEPNHGMKHWGHCVSDDLVNWKEEDVALIPDQEYEKNGCYSGNAIEKDEILHLFYTANYKLENGKIPKQALAYMDKDGHITKEMTNPVIDGAPAKMTGEIRDPFVFEKNGEYYMLLGGKTQEEEGALLVYKSHNLIDWQYVGELDLSINTGYMIECPGYIEVDGKDVLMLSVMGLEKEELKYQNQFTSLYLIGTLDLEHLKFHIETMDEIDNGFDFYAPQVFYGKDKAPMMLSWFGCGEQRLISDKDMWKHGLTMPHILKISDHRLCNYISDDINKAFNNHHQFEDTKTLTESNTYHIQFDLSKQGNEWVRFGDENDYWEFSIDFDKNVMTLDRSHLHHLFDQDNGLIRQCEALNKEEYKVDIYVDNSFVEIFVNEGSRSFMMRCFNLHEMKHEIRFKYKAVGTIDYFNK